MLEIRHLTLDNRFKDLNHYIKAVTMKKIIAIFVIILPLFIFGFDVIIFFMSLFNMTPISYKSPSDFTSDAICMHVNVKKYNPHVRDSLGRFVVSVSFTDTSYSRLTLKGKEKVAIQFVSEDSIVRVPAIEDRTRGIGEPKIYYYSYSPLWSQPVQKIEIFYTNKKKEEFVSYIIYPKEIGLISPQDNDTISIAKDTLLIKWKHEICPNIVIIKGANLRNMTFNRNIDCINHKKIIFPNNLTLKISSKVALSDVKDIMGHVWAKWEIKGVVDPRLSQQSLFYDTFTDSSTVNIIP